MDPASDFWRRAGYIYTRVHICTPRSPHLVFTIRLALLIALYWQSFHFKLYPGTKTGIPVSRSAAGPCDARRAGWKYEQLPVGLPTHTRFKLHVTNVLSAFFFNFQVSIAQWHCKRWTYVYYVCTYIPISRKSVRLGNRLARMRHNSSELTGTYLQ